RDLPPKKRADRDIADAERLGNPDADEPDHQAAELRPPHPVEREPGEGILRRVDRARQDRGQRAGNQSGERTAEQARRTDEERMRRGGKERPEPDEVAAGGRRGGARAAPPEAGARAPLGRGERRPAPPPP